MAKKQQEYGNDSIRQLKGADPNMTTEDLIRHALRAMVMKG